MADCMDENVLKFKLHAKQVRDNYKKVIDEELEETERFYCECEELRNNTKSKNELIQNSIQNISNDVKNIRENVSTINLYGIDKILEVVKKFENMTEHEKTLINKLLEVKNDA